MGISVESTLSSQPAPAQRAYSPIGSAVQLIESREPEICLSGPAGTGKSRASLEKQFLLACKYPNSRHVIVRKTRASLTQSAVVTFENHVIPAGWLGKSVRWRTNEQEYRFSNKSVIALAGMDKPGKVMSTEWDSAYVQEAIDLTEEDWESLSSRLRNGAMPYQQLLSDTNPGPPAHWLKKRADRGVLKMVESRHEENPTLFDLRTGEWTERGKAYIERLERLTGVRYKRLRCGLWVAAEGQVYESYDPAVHLIYRADMPGYDEKKTDPIPADWPRYWAVDFGYTNPFVWQAWARDPDGRLFRYREIYHTQRLVEDHAQQILKVTEHEPRPVAVICDHDAEGRATLERHLKLNTVAAYKPVQDGIQAVQARLRKVGDGRTRLYFLRDSLVERDPALDEKKLPACSEEEIESYVWDLNNGRKKGEEPKKEHDHGMDAIRYLVAHFDLNGPATVTHGESIY